MANAHDLLMAQRAAMMGGKPLPYLRRVAYLESHGTEYIKTGIVPEIGNVYNVSFEVVELRGFSTSTFNVFSGNSSFYTGTSLSCDTITSGGFRVSNGSYSQSRIIPVIGEKYNISIEDSRYLINGSVFNLGIGSLENFELYLFGANRNGGFQSVTGAFIRLYEFSVGAKLKMIPVLDLSGRPAMYDEVSGNLFYNQGTTGEFTWGELET